MLSTKDAAKLESFKQNLAGMVGVLPESEVPGIDPTLVGVLGEDSAISVKVNTYIQERFAEAQKVYSDAIPQLEAFDEKHEKGYITEDEYDEISKSQIEPYFESNAELIVEMTNVVSEYDAKYPGLLTNETVNETYGLPESTERETGEDIRDWANHEILKQKLFTPERYMNIYSNIKGMESVENDIASVEDRLEARGSLTPNEYKDYTLLLDNYRFDKEDYAAAMARDVYLIDRFNNPDEYREYDRRDIGMNIADNGSRDMQTWLNKEFIDKIPLSMQLPCFESRRDNGYPLSPTQVNDCIRNAAIEFDDMQRVVACEEDDKLSCVQFMADRQALHDYLLKYPKDCIPETARRFNEVAERHNFSLSKVTAEDIETYGHQHTNDAPEAPGE